MSKYLVITLASLLGGCISLDSSFELMAKTFMASNAWGAALTCMKSENGSVPNTVIEVYEYSPKKDACKEIIRDFHNPEYNFFRYKYSDGKIKENSSNNYTLSFTKGIKDGEVVNLDPPMKLNINYKNSVEDKNITNGSTRI